MNKIAKARENEENTDFILTSNDGKDFPCHFAILSIQAHEYFSGTQAFLRNTGNRMTADYVNAQDLASLLDYVYYGIFPKNGDFESLYQQAEFFGMKALANFCSDKAFSETSNQNAIGKLKFANKFDVQLGEEGKEHKKRVLKFLKRNFKDLGQDQKESLTAGEMRE